MDAIVFSELWVAPGGKRRRPCRRRGNYLASFQIDVRTGRREATADPGSDHVKQELMMDDFTNSERHPLTNARNSPSVVFILDFKSRHIRS
jgi:hypothetical protein